MAAGGDVGVDCAADLLSDDIWSENILPRLPLKPLFLLSCVSKSFRRLISDDDALRRKLAPIACAVYYIPDDGTGGKERPSFAWVRDGGMAECGLGFFPSSSGAGAIVDCSNGLLLLLCRRGGSSVPRAPEFYVCSPVTERWVAIPAAGKKSLLSILGFDPSSSPHFKVMCFTGWREQGADMEIYSSETGEWSEQCLRWPAGIRTDAMSANVRYFSGVLYILALSLCAAVAVDLTGGASDCLRIDLPETTRHDGCLARPAGGPLHYASNNGKQIRIWVDGDSDGGWFLKHNISVGSVIQRKPSSSVRCSLVGFQPEMGVAYLWVAEPPPGKLVSYDIVSGEVSEEIACNVVGGGSESKKMACYVIQVWRFHFTRAISNCLL